MTVTGVRASEVSGVPEIATVVLFPSPDLEIPIADLKLRVSVHEQTVSRMRPLHNEMGPPSDDANSVDAAEYGRKVGVVLESKLLHSAVHAVCSRAMATEVPILNTGHAVQHGEGSCPHDRRLRVTLEVVCAASPRGIPLSGPRVCFSWY